MGQSETKKDFEYKNVSIEWYGHDSFSITDKDSKKTVYIDPFNLNKHKGTLKSADVILITHSHYDHYDKKSIELISNYSTRIFVPKDVDGSLNLGIITTIEPEIDMDLGFVKIETVAAYNINKPFHPKANNWVGYIVVFGSTRIYHAGDTDLIPEMRNLGNIDIALLPVSGKYVMTATEAAEACNIIHPTIAIPMHYGSIIGSEKDAKIFKELSKFKTIIL